MAEFLTMDEAKNHFGTKGKTNAALTLGIIGTALGAMNNSGCGNGILGNLFGGNCQQNRLDNEAGFMSFIGLKFSQEYVTSPDGKIAAENLLATIRKSKAHIQSQIKAKEEKVNTLLELMESDPEMKKRFDELMINKSSKQ